MVLLLAAAAAVLLLRPVAAYNRDAAAPPAAASAPRAAAAGAAAALLLGESFDESLAPVSRRHAAEARRALADFDAAFQGTFSRGAAEAPAEAVRGLFARRARALTALGEIRLRLPNDLDLERALAAAAESCDRHMLERIEDARERTGAVLLHPGPVDDAWYGRWYRARNDVVE